MNERIKEVRKALGLSQEEFGRRLGFTRGAITNIELKKVDPKPLLIDLLCREFHVSYDWLTTGEGEMFDNLPECILDELALQYGLNKADVQIIKDYMELPPEDRAVIQRFMNRFGQ